MFALRLLLVLGKRLLQSLPKTLTLTHNPNPLPIKQLTTAHAWSIGSGKITRTEQRLLSHQTAITPPLFQTTALRPHVAVSSRVPLYFKSYAMSGPEKIRSRGLWSHIVS